MCGRFTQFYTWAEVHAFLGVLDDATPRNLQPRYNIAPTDTIDVAAIGKEGACKLVPMRWGLVPAWWRKELAVKVGAEADGLGSAPAFTAALCGRRVVARSVCRKSIMNRHPDSRLTCRRAADTPQRRQRRCRQTSIWRSEKRKV